MLGGVEEDNETPTFEVEGLELSVNFEGMELPGVCTVKEDLSWSWWKCRVYIWTLGISE